MEHTRLKRIERLQRDLKAANAMLKAYEITGNELGVKRKKKEIIRISKSLEELI